MGTEAAVQGSRKKEERLALRNDLRAATLHVCCIKSGEAMAAASALERDEEDGTLAASPRKRRASKKYPATVLVVEDETLVRMAAADYLRDCGYRVLETASAREARRLFAAGEAIEIVFSDIDLGRDIDGFVLARWVRQHHPHVRILLVSGVRRAVGLEQLSDGPFMLKPYSYVDLAANIEALLNARRMQ